MTRQAPEWFGGGTSTVQGGSDGSLRSPSRSSSRSGRSRKVKDSGSSSVKSHRRRKSKDDSSTASDSRKKEKNQQSQKQGGAKKSTTSSPEVEALLSSQKNKASQIKSKGDSQRRKSKLAKQSATTEKIPQALVERQQQSNEVPRKSSSLKTKDIAQRLIGGLQRLSAPNVSRMLSPSRKEKKPLNSSSSIVTNHVGENQRMAINGGENNAHIITTCMPKQQKEHRVSLNSTTKTEGNRTKDNTSTSHEKKYPTQQKQSSIVLPQDDHLPSPELSYKLNNDLTNHSLESDDCLTYSDDDHGRTSAIQSISSIKNYQSLSLRGEKNKNYVRNTASQHLSAFKPGQKHDAYTKIRGQDEIVLLARQKRHSSFHPPSYGAMRSNDMYLSDSSCDMQPESHLRRKKQTIPQIPGVIPEEEVNQITSSGSEVDDKLLDAGEHSERNHDWDQQRRYQLSLDILNVPPHGRVCHNEETNHNSGKVLPNNCSTSSTSEGTHNGTPPLSTLLVTPINQHQQHQSLPQTVLFSSNSPRALNYSLSTLLTPESEFPSRRTLTKKEKRQHRKRLLQRENAENIEDRVQSIVHGGDSNDMDWSRLAPQKVGGMNRAAGLFPTEETPKSTKDRPFAVLFLLHLCAITYIAFKYGNLTIISRVSSVDSEIPTNVQVNAVLRGDDPFSTQGSNDPFSTSMSDPFSSTTDNNPFSSTTDKDPFSKPMNEDPFSTATLSGDPSSRKSFWTQNIQVNYSSAFDLACIAALQAISLALLVVTIMMILNSALIQTFLVTIVVATLSFSIIGVAVSPYNIIPVLGLIGLALSLGYCIVVWDRVAFATTNLNIALIGIKCSADLLMVSFGMMLVAFLWTMLWAVSFLGVYDVFLSTNDAHTSQDDVTWTGLAVYFGMFFSYIWTYNVIQNIVHVTVAGVVGTWWINPDSLTSCCTSSLLEQFGKAMSSSFGSICLGSLMTPPALVLRLLSSVCSFSSFNTVTHNIISSDTACTGNINGDSGSLPDATSPIDRMPYTSSSFDCILNNCSDFGLTYVGLYGESFWTGSKKATDVFKERGWMGVVSDQLIPNILKIATILISLVTGLFTFIVEEFDGYQLTNYSGRAGSTAFLIGCCIGTVLSSICLQIVASSVSTVLVCFSVAPFAFKHHHPGLSNDMRRAWGGVWLDEFQLPEQQA